MEKVFNIEHNAPQPYAVAGWLVRLQNCVKGAVSGVRWVVGEPVSFLRIYFLSVGKL